MSENRLTKADILRQASDSEENITYEYFEKLDGELPLRPLSDGEAQQIENKQLENLDFSFDNIAELEGKGKQEILDEVDFSISLDEFFGDDYEANCLTCSFGIAFEEKMTVKEVKQLRPPGIVEDIANRIREISGMEGSGVEDALKSFREDEES